MVPNLHWPPRFISSPKEAGDDVAKVTHDWAFPREMLKLTFRTEPD